MILDLKFINNKVIDRTIFQVNIWGHFIILKFEFQNVINKKEVLTIYIVLNKKLTNYKVVSLIELYSFDIKFSFIRLHVQRLWIF